MKPCTELLQIQTCHCVRLIVVLEPPRLAVGFIGGSRAFGFAQLESPHRA